MITVVRIATRTEIVGVGKTTHSTMLRYFTKQNRSLLNNLVTLFVYVHNSVCHLHLNGIQSLPRFVLVSRTGGAGGLSSSLDIMFYEFCLVWLGRSPFLLSRIVSTSKTSVNQLARKIFSTHFIRSYTRWTHQAKAPT